MSVSIHYMSSGLPVIRQTSTPAILFHLVLIFGSIYLGEFILGRWYGVYLGPGFYFLYAQTSRWILASDHRKGMKLLYQNKHEEAIRCFEDSVAFFRRNAWVDKYRALTMLSPSKMSYLEISLINIAFCYTQLGRGDKAKEYYELTLKEFPASGIAKAGLNIINSAQGIPPVK